MRISLITTTIVSAVCVAAVGIAAEPTPPAASAVQAEQAPPPSAQPVEEVSTSPLGPPRASAFFPAPLGSESRPDTRTVPLPQKRAQAMQAYLSGKDAAEKQHDYAAALEWFRRALSFEMSSTSLYAAAQCRKVLNRPVEALFTYAQALMEDSRAPVNDRLPAPFLADAKSTMNNLIKQFTAVHVVLPDEVVLEKVSIRGFPVITTDFFGQLSKPVLLAGVRSRWIPKAAPTYQKEFTFYSLPGRYDMNFELAGGGRLALEKRQISGNSTIIDFTKESLPSKIVVENLQPGTHLVVRSGNAPPVVDETFSELIKEYPIDGIRQGEYQLDVRRRGFKDFNESLLVIPAEEARLYLDMTPLKPQPLVKSWKFWVGVGAAAAVVIGTVVAIAVVSAHKNKSTPDEGGQGAVIINLVNP